MFNFQNQDDFYIICLLILTIIGLTIGCLIGRCCTKKKCRTWVAQNRGEALVRQSLNEYCKNKAAHVLNCITLRLEDGSTTQIDHILVSTKGIFVIETKHYKGWILGKPKSKEWKQIIFNNKYAFQNPLFQNYKHVREIQRIFDFLDPRLIHNIVVFSGDSAFLTDKIDNVCDLEELISTIDKHSDGALSLNRVQFCVGRLEYMRLELTEKTDIEHQEYLARKFGGLEQFQSKPFADNFFFY